MRKWQRKMWKAHKPYYLHYPPPPYFHVAIFLYLNFYLHAYTLVDVCTILPFLHNSCTRLYRRYGVIVHALHRLYLNYFWLVQELELPPWWRRLMCYYAHNKCICICSKPNASISLVVGFFIIVAMTTQVKLLLIIVEKTKLTILIDKRTPLKNDFAHVECFTVRVHVHNSFTMTS